jgi:hypothetical protein
MFNFDSVADDDAKARRDIVSQNPNAMTQPGGAGATSGNVAGMFQVADDVPPLTPASPVTWAINNLTVGRETNDYTGKYSTGMGYAKDVSMDLAKALKARGLGAFTGSQR